MSKTGKDAELLVYRGLKSQDGVLHQYVRRNGQCLVFLSRPSILRKSNDVLSHMKVLDLTHFPTAICKVSIRSGRVPKQHNPYLKTTRSSFEINVEMQNTDNTTRPAADRKAFNLDYRLQGKDWTATSEMSSG